MAPKIECYQQPIDGRAKQHACYSHGGSGTRVPYTSHNVQWVWVKGRSILQSGETNREKLWFLVASHTKYFSHMPCSGWNLVQHFYSAEARREHRAACSHTIKKIPRNRKKQMEKATSTLMIKKWKEEKKKRRKDIFVAVGGDGSRSTVRLTSCGTPCNPAGCDASASKSNASTKHDRSSYIPSPRLLTFLNSFFF